MKALAVQKNFTSACDRQQGPSLNALLHTQLQLSNPKVTTRLRSNFSKRQEVAHPKPFYKWFLGKNAAF